MNKTTEKILQIFVGNITEQFTLREVARKLNMHVSLTHKAIQPLIENKLVLHNKRKNLYLNIKTDHNSLVFSEYLRKDEFLQNDKSGNIALFASEVINKIKEDSFVLLVFGSAVISNKPRDIDILLIIDSTDKVEFHEKFLHNIASNYETLFDVRVIGFESVYEMLSKREETNIMNELLNKHIILYGSELFFRLINNGRK